MSKINKSLEILTNWIGGIMVGLSLIIVTAPIFVEVKRDYTEHWWFPLSIFICGIMLIGAKEAFFSSLAKFLNKKSDQL